MARQANGAGAPEELSPLVANLYPLTASPDGRLVVFKEGPAAQFGLRTLSLGADQSVTPILEFKRQSVNSAEVSPDGRWIAPHEGRPRSGSSVVRLVTPRTVTPAG